MIEELNSGERERNEGEKKERKGGEDEEERVKTVGMGMWRRRSKSGDCGLNLYKCVRQYQVNQLWRDTHQSSDPDMSWYVITVEPSKKLGS